MKNSLLAGLGLVSLFAGPVMAADLPAKTPYVKVSPAYNWTGCYAGASFGSLFVQQDWGAFGGDDGTGLVLGGQAGCNYQISSWVFGIQGDAAWTDAKGNHADNVVTNGEDEWKKNMLSSLTARFGYTPFDRWLAYGKGGVAWTHNRLNFSDISTADETRGGWVLGAGLEYAITNHVTMFFEYDFYNFGTRTVGFAGGAVPIDIREHEGYVKVGGNWKFGW